MPILAPQVRPCVTHEFGIRFGASELPGALRGDTDLMCLSVGAIESQTDVIESPAEGSGLKLSRTMRPVIPSTGVAPTSIAEAKYAPTSSS